MRAKAPKLYATTEEKFSLDIDLKYIKNDIIAVQPNRTLL